MDKIIKQLMINKYDKTTKVKRDEVISLLDEIRYVVFLDFFEDISSNKEEYITMKLLSIKDKLTKQLLKLGYIEITEIVNSFLTSLPDIKHKLETDVEAFIESDPAATSPEEIILSYPGLYSISVHRIAHELYKLGIKQIPRIMAEYAHNRTGIDINPGAEIGNYFFIDHGTGVVIGETTNIGNHVKIYQGVTLGAISINDASKLKGVKRHPTIKDNVTIYSGECILGGDTIINDNVTIGSNTFITKSIEPNKLVIFANTEYIEKDKFKK